MTEVVNQSALMPACPKCEWVLTEAAWTKRQCSTCGYRFPAFSYAEFANFLMGKDNSMGRPQLNEFRVIIHTNDDGEPVGLRYYDQEGCGHEGPALSLSEPLETLVDYHERHRITSHKMSPRKRRCEHLVIPGVEQTRCSLNEGHQSMSAGPEEYSEKHKVELSR